MLPSGGFRCEDKSHCCALLSVSESVREAVGRRVKLSLRRRVQLEVKGDKWENRVLVSVAAHRPTSRNRVWPPATEEEDSWGEPPGD